ncbi:MAG: hypothetical protein JWP84_96 [Tardiphaga sp.]|nr:hypothetical protein [Tardiphaga sp.]
MGAAPRNAPSRFGAGRQAPAFAAATSRLVPRIRIEIIIIQIIITWRGSPASKCWARASDAAVSPPVHRTAHRDPSEPLPTQKGFWWSFGIPASSRGDVALGRRDRASWNARISVVRPEKNAGRCYSQVLHRRNRDLQKLLISLGFWPLFCGWRREWDSLPASPIMQKTQIISGSSQPGRNAVYHSRVPPDNRSVPRVHQSDSRIASPH